jgi:hypothetical protein
MSEREIFFGRFAAGARRQTACAHRDLADARVGDVNPDTASRVVAVRNRFDCCDAQLVAATGHSRRFGFVRFRGIADMNS